MKKIFLIGLVLLVAGYVYGEVPCKINYQGRLIKDNVPVNGTRTMRFSIYDSEKEGTQLWTSGDVNVTVYNGLFRYVLGSGGGDLSGIDWTAGQVFYLEVTAGGETLSPREPIYAYPYAINTHFLEGKTTAHFLDVSGSTQTKQGGLNIVGDVGIEGNVKADNIWMKVAEVDISNSTGYTISGLNGDKQKMYKVIFQGSIAAGGADRRILIRPNGVATGYRSFAYYEGDAVGSEWDNTGFYVGRNGWLGNGVFAFEYTISAITGRRRVGFGEATFCDNYHTVSYSILGFTRASGYWGDTTTNITSLWVGPIGGTISGKLMVFALQ